MNITKKKITSILHRQVGPVILGPHEKILHWAPPLQFNVMLQWGNFKRNPMVPTALVAKTHNMHSDLNICHLILASNLCYISVTPSQFSVRSFTPLKALKNKISP